MHIFLLLVSFMALISGAISSSPPSPSFSIAPAPDIQQYFYAHQSGWYDCVSRESIPLAHKLICFFLFFFPRMGADVATSIPWQGSKYIWIWGDTLWGNISDGIRKISAFPRNSLSIVDMTDPAGQTFCASRSIESCALNITSHGDPLPPPDENSGDNKGFFSTGNSSTWLWPSHGVVLGNTAYFNTATLTQTSPGT